MTKKKLLIIFILAVLVTGGSYYLPGPFYRSGAPLPYYAVAVSHHFIRRWFVPEVFAIDFLIWFVILVIGWWVFKKIKK